MGQWVKAFYWVLTQKSFKAELNSWAKCQQLFLQGWEGPSGFSDPMGLEACR